ncbi:MAG: chromosome segregation protein SMC [Candidatus Thorarchaeota archaeon]|nr:chromosome segregation protein SMC [Candidatus Thorarchaeota archaeon]
MDRPEYSIGRKVGRDCILVHIDKLVCKGFKSFGRETVTINFSPGFTCIVGPNGSGKSNVIDAILFVLGQLSAKTLRANVFSDLLYSPPKPNMPPKARSALVELHFDNRDRKLQIEADRVVIERELDDTGKSTCRINGKVVTRSSVLEVLGAIGVDPNGYNLVLQGEIAQIVKVSPIDRRKLIEEIAGISAYDEQKERALKKLAESESNLGKVEMQLQERRRQLEKLEEERSDAFRHKSITEKIKAISADSYAWRIVKCRNRIETIHETLAERAEEAEKLEREHAEAEKKAKQTEEQIDAIDTEIDGITGGASARISEQYGVVSAAVDHLRRDLERTRIELENLTEEKSSVQVEMQSIKDQVEGSLALTDEKEQELSRLNNEIAECSRKVTSLEEHIEKEQESILEATQRLQDLNNQMRMLDEGVSEVRSAIKSDSKELGMAYEELQDSKNLLERTEDELVELRRIIPVKREELQKSEEDESVKRVKVDELEKRLRTIDEEEREAGKIVKATREELIRIQARQDALKDAEEAFLKKKHALARVLELRDSNTISGIYGTVAELGVINPEYATAMEVAGGNRLSYIVVESDHAASECIDILKRERVGRASFIPLNKIRTKQSGKLPSDKGVIGFAIDLVSFEPKMKPAFDFVFSDTIVTENFETAKRLGFKGMRAVSLEGDLVEKSGLITGGHYHRTSVGLSLQEKDISPQIAERLKGLEKVHNGLLDQQEELRKQKSIFDHEIQDLSKTNYRAQLELDGLDERLKEKENRSAVLKERIATAEVTIEALEKQIGELTERDNELSQHREMVREQRDDVNEQLAKSDTAKLTQYMKDLKEVMERHKQEREALMSEITSLKVALDERLKPKLMELDLRHQSLAKATPDLEIKVKELKDELAEKEEEFLKLKAERDQIDEAVKDKRVLQLELKEKLRNFRLRHEEIREEQTANEKAVYRLQTEQSRLETDIVGFVAELNEISRADEEVAKRTTLREITYKEIDDFEDKIKELERELEALGPVNLKALTDYDLEKDKYEEIVDKKTKLEEEHKEILAFMEEIEAEKTRKFLQVYNEIADNFASVFSKLSPDGEATLMLENPEHPLMGGITVKSKPRGKELVTLDAMSGGEKTITGLALIFAIQMYNPASFYIFDEIDAALDDVNAHNVALLIAEMSKSSQFVIVSLRDTTVSKADLLIGVSNQDGISRIVKVDLEEVGSAA